MCVCVYIYIYIYYIYFASVTWIPIDFPLEKSGIVKILSSVVSSQVSTLHDFS